MEAPEAIGHGFPMAAAGGKRAMLLIEKDSRPDKSGSPFFGATPRVKKYMTIRATRTAAAMNDRRHFDRGLSKWQ